MQVLRLHEKCALRTPHFAQNDKPLEPLIRQQRPGCNSAAGGELTGGHLPLDDTGLAELVSQNQSL